MVADSNTKRHDGTASKRQKEHALCAKAPLRPRLLADAGASRLRRDSVSPQQIVSVMLEAQR